MTFWLILKTVPIIAPRISEKPAKNIEARDKFNEALRMPITTQQRTFVKDQLSKLSDQWLFSRTIIPGDNLCENYQVKPGMNPHH